ncbi:MAG: LLM class F420-dependent oxidoreductase [Ilumatobacteraceae bacterium]
MSDGPSLTGPGVWSGQLRYGDPAEAAEAASELEELGYSALWIPDVGGDVFGAVANLLRATERATIATGILNIWMHSPEETAAQFDALTTEHGRRFLLGVGVSHAPLIDRVKEAGTYRRPLQQVAEFLDGLDAADVPVAPHDRVIAALGPKMLELAHRRTAGTHPYLVTPEHTATAREVLGAGPVVAVEQGVVLETDADSARANARQHLATYLALPNYSNNWKRIGFTDDDLADGGSDRLVDALYVWGDESTIAARVQEHRDAGADHVCVQVVTADPRAMPRAEWRALAPALL